MTVPDALVTTFLELTFTFDSQMEGVVQSTISAFAQFPAEASIIGRLLAGYADPEIAMLNCASFVRDDFDTALKVMFRAIWRVPATSRTT
jgi:hypothetical protein